MFKNYSRTFLEYVKNMYVISRWMMETKLGCQYWRDYKGPSNTFVWQFLDGKYESFIA